MVKNDPSPLVLKTCSSKKKHFFLGGGAKFFKPLQSIREIVIVGENVMKAKKKRNVFKADVQWTGDLLVAHSNERKKEF